MVIVWKFLKIQKKVKFDLEEEWLYFFCTQNYMKFEKNLGLMVFLFGRGFFHLGVIGSQEINWDKFLEWFSIKSQKFGKTMKPVSRFQ